MRNQPEGSTTRPDLNLDNLDPLESSFLRGCLIGDGWLGLQRNKFVYLRIGHSSKQLEWLKWKADKLNKILQKERCVLGPYKTKDSKGGNHLSYLYTVDDHKLFKTWFNRWYTPQQNQKTIKKIDFDFLYGLDLQALSILWCDDGSLWHSKRTKKHKLKSGQVKEYPYTETAGSIATCCFTYGENVLIADWIESLTAVRPLIGRDRKYYKLVFNKSKLLQFIPQIEKFVPDCMNYKVNLSQCFK